MKIRLMREFKGEVIYEGEMNIAKLNEFKEHWEGEMSGKYCWYIVTFYFDNEGVMCFYPDGPWEC